MRLSINIDNAHDLYSSNATYYSTPQAQDFVRHVGTKALGGGAAHALEGPYGVGKSSLVAFALNQLACKTTTFEPIRDVRLLDDKDSPIVKVNENGGLLPLTIIGSFDSLITRIFQALDSFVINNPSLSEAVELKSILKQTPSFQTPEKALDILESFSKVVRSHGKAGLLIVIDEFGRHLDHMVDATSSQDFHLLQGIAEITGRRVSPISLIIVQHLGLDHYTARFFGDKKLEWEKVRGRFWETVLSNTETDTAHIIARTMALLGVNPDQTNLKPCRPRSIVQTVALLKDKEYQAVVKKCRPLHPMTVILLSRLARILGQQDRTVIGWLTTDSSTGFSASCARNPNSWIYPYELFDHFFGESLNIPAHPTFARRLASIQRAADRCEDSMNLQTLDLFKVLSILGFCSGKGVTANETVARSCLPAHFPLVSCMKQLVEKSLFVYRAYRDEYVVWEGSDYDVVGRIDQELTNVTLNAAEEMNSRAGLKVLAHRHYIDTGNRRISRLFWLNSYESPPAQINVPRVLIWLDNIPNDKPRLLQDVCASIPSESLEPHLKASVAIKQLIDEDPELQDDHIAVQEMRIRLDYHESRVQAITQELLESKETIWVLNEQHYLSLQRAISEAMDRVYRRAFVLHLDMLNRDRLSGQISFALRKLIDALYRDHDKKNLGIVKFPAERIIYESFLKKNKLHSCDPKKVVYYLNASSSESPDGLRAVIAKIRECFTANGPAVQSLDDIVATMAEPPYGMKTYPTLLLCIILLLSEKDSYEIYEDDQYVPYWGPQTLLRMVKAPKRFTISIANEMPVSTTFMMKYHQALTGDQDTIENLKPVAVVRALLKHHSTLSIYSRQTKSVSQDAQKLVRALRIAKSPSDMLYQAIPSALGYESIQTRGTLSKEYLKAVSNARISLEKADEQLIQRFRSILLDILSSDSLSDARNRCVDLANTSMGDSQMFHNYNTFVKSVLANTTSSDETWFKGVLDDGLGIATPIDSWSDEHVAHAEFVLRRTLISVQQADRLLTQLELAENENPFAIFLSNARSDLDNSLTKRIASMLMNLDKEQQMATVVSIAKVIKESS